MFIFQKIWRALFSWNTRFEIRPFALLPTIICFGCKICISQNKHRWEWQRLLTFSEISCCIWRQHYYRRKLVYKSHFWVKKFAISVKWWTLQWYWNTYFNTGFIQKTIVLFYVIEFSGGATFVEDPFKLFKNSKLQFLEGAIRLKKMTNKWNKIERTVERIKFDENFQPDKIFVILLDEEKNEIRTELKGFPNNLQLTK